jgi:hypothetical protein
MPVPELWGDDNAHPSDFQKYKKDASKPSLQTSTVIGDNQDDLISGLVGSPMGMR